MFGDILFYFNDGSIPGNLIQWRTGSKIIHVAIRFDETSQIAALSQGVRLMQYVPTSLAYRPVNVISPAKEAQLRNWLHAQIGDEYSYADIFDDLFKLSGKMLLVGKCAFDCSHLAAAFLSRWGDPIVKQFPHFETVTPGDLAHAAGFEE